MSLTSSTAASSGPEHTTWSIVSVSRRSWWTFRRSSPPK